MNKWSFKEKIKNTGQFLKDKFLPLLLVSSTFGFGGLLTACSENKKPDDGIIVPPDPPKPPIIEVDKEKELKNAKEELARFMARVQAEKNFTAEIETTLPAQKYTICIDGNKAKTSNSGKISYVVNEDENLYKIFQTEDQSWHKDNADEGTKSAEDIVSELIVGINKIAWTNYDKDSKSLSVTTPEYVATAHLDDEQVSFTAGSEGRSENCTLSDVGTTLVTLPENVIDDTQTITPPDPELTEEQKQAIMTKNLFNAIGEKAFESSIGREAQINDIYAIDYVSNTDGNYIYMLIDNTTMSGRKIDFVRFPSTSELTDKNILTNNITPITTRCGERILSQSARILETSNTEKALNIFEKLKNDNLIQTMNPDVCFYSTIDGGVDNTLKCGTHYVYFYSLSKNSIEYSALRVKSDAGTLDHISDYLINGSLNETFRQTDHFQHEFTENVLYNINGLQYQVEEEQI